MHEIMKGLTEDHRNLAQVLKIMQLQIERIAAGDDKSLALMLDASHYIQSYSDMIHHPKENIIFEVFEKRSNEEAAVLATLFEQHESLPVETIKFQSMLDEAIHGLGFISREELVANINSFLELEWQHMNLEESIIFPLINKALVKKEWELLDELIEADMNPIFSGDIKKSFNNLHQSIMDQAT